MLNLLSNAIKFTNKGKINLKITLLDIKNNQAKIEISVNDTGIGIAKDELEKIFDRFYRTHPSYEAEYKGYGIGEVITVTEGKAALNALQTHCFNWALLDIGLPKLLGTEVAKRYRQWEKEHNKPRLTLFALDEVKNPCEEAGIDYILNKPFTEKDVHIIQLVMEGRN